MLNSRLFGSLRWFLLAICADASWLPGHAGAQNTARPGDAVTIEYIAHACFRVISPAGKQLLIDPFASRVWIGYDFPPDIHADAVLISHPHYDHDGGEAMGRKVPWPPNTPVLRNAGTNHLGDITIVGYAGKHADPWGKEFGQSNTIWSVEVAGLRIVHLGDNGPLNNATIEQIGRVDVLMAPIDSQFHILKSDEIAVIRRRLSPSVLIPMHYRHDDLELFPEKPEQLGGIESWAKAEGKVRYLAANKENFSFPSLPKKPEVLIFKHSPLVKPSPKIKEDGHPAQVPGGALDLIGPAIAFRRAHRRWPRDYAELSSTVSQSGGPAPARQYDRVDLAELADGSLEISSVTHGQTNRITIPK